MLFEEISFTDFTIDKLIEISDVDILRNIILHV